MTAQRAEKLAARRNKRRKKKIEQKFPLFANDPAIAPNEVTTADIWREYDKLIARFVRIEIEEIRKCFEANILLKHVTHDVGINSPLLRFRAQYRTRGELAYRVCDYCRRVIVLQDGGIAWLDRFNDNYNQDLPKTRAFWRAWHENARRQKRFRVGLFANPWECSNNGGE